MEVEKKEQAVGWHCHYATLDTQPKEFSKGDFMDINAESGCAEKDEDVPG